MFTQLQRHNGAVAQLTAWNLLSCSFRVAVHKTMLVPSAFPPPKLSRKKRERSTLPRFFFLARLAASRQLELTKSLSCAFPHENRTWGYTLKAKGWRQLGTLAELDDAQLRMRNSLKVGLYINVAGMLLALIGAEQIVGTLVAKVLYSQGEGRSSALSRTIIYVLASEFFLCVFCVCFYRVRYARLKSAQCCFTWVTSTTSFYHRLAPPIARWTVVLLHYGKVAVGAMPPSKFDTICHHVIQRYFWSRFVLGDVRRRLDRWQVLFIVCCVCLSFVNSLILERAAIIYPIGCCACRRRETAVE